MSHRNNNLSYTAYSQIHKGRALKLRTDGMVEEISDASADMIIGWSMENHEAGQAVSVRTITEGTMECEVKAGETIYSGKWIRIADDGTITAVSAGVPYMGICLDRIVSSGTTAKYVQALMLRQIPLADQSA